MSEWQSSQGASMPGPVERCSPGEGLGAASDRRLCSPQARLLCRSQEDFTGWKEENWKGKYVYGTVLDKFEPGLGRLELGLGPALPGPVWLWRVFWLTCNLFFSGDETACLTLQSWKDP